MNQRDRDAIFLRQYSLLPKLLRVEPTPEVTEEALAFLMSRDAVTGAARHELARLDEQLAEALAATSDEWREFADGVAEDCGFAEAPWWVAVRQRSRQDGARVPAPSAR